MQKAYTTTYSKDVLNIIATLLDRAAKGVLLRDEFYSSWPLEETESDPFLVQVFDDIESAVEHIPSSFLTGKINFPEWRRSEDYRCIVADSHVLSLFGTKSSMVLLEKRRRLLAKGV